jgi:predicted MFS family arabinose efflux permease
MIAPMLLAFPYISLLPLMAKSLLACGPDKVGTLLSLTAVGSLVSSATIIGSSERVLRGRFQIVSLLIFSLSLVVGVMAPSFAVAALAMFVAGGASQAYRTVSRILVQTGVPKHLQGRVVSLVLMDRALIPVGTLFLGWWAEHFGVLSCGMAMGVGTGLVTLLFVILNPRIWWLKPLPEKTTSCATGGLLMPGKILTPGPT